MGSSFYRLKKNQKTTKATNAPLPQPQNSKPHPYSVETENMGETTVYVVLCVPSEYFNNSVT